MAERDFYISKQKMIKYFVKFGWISVVVAAVVALLVFHKVSNIPKTVIYPDAREYYVASLIHVPVGYDEETKHVKSNVTARVLGNINAILNSGSVTDSINALMEEKGKTTRLSQNKIVVENANSDYIRLYCLTDDYEDGQEILKAVMEKAIPQAMEDIQYSVIDNAVAYVCNADHKPIRKVDPEEEKEYYSQVSYIESTVGKKEIAVVIAAFFATNCLILLVMLLDTKIYSAKELSMICRLAVATEISPSENKVSNPFAWQWVKEDLLKNGVKVLCFGEVDLGDGSLKKYCIDVKKDYRTEVLSDGNGVYLAVPKFEKMCEIQKVMKGLELANCKIKGCLFVL